MDERGIISQYGGLSRTLELVRNYRAKRILLVTGRQSFTSCGAKAILDTALAGYEVTRFCDFDVNPKMQDALRGTQLARDINADLILAVGGGSPMDIAKLIKAFLPNPSQAGDMVRGHIPVPPNDMPLIMVPSTAGSGSEATHFAVVYIGKEKFSLAAPQLLPTSYILDGQLLLTASTYQRAVNGLDALAQATEGAWAVRSTKESRELSYGAISALVKHLPNLMQENSPIALQAVMEAANQAGQIINITKTTAPHAFSYGFTSYHDIAHGHAVWLTLPAIFARHMSVIPEKITDPRGVKHFQSIMKHLAKIYDIDDTSTAEATLKKFMTHLGVEPDMKKLGAVSTQQRQFLSTKVNAERLSNNPIELTPKDIVTIFGLE